MTMSARKQPAGFDQIIIRGNTMKRNSEHRDHILHAAAILPSLLLSAGLTMPALSAHATIVSPDEVIVMARRTEEAIQTVPISMTVMSQDMLDEKNVTSGADLANYTPSLNVNTRFGSDQASFSIRGFTQEIRTAACRRRISWCMRNTHVVIVRVR